MAGPPAGPGADSGQLLIAAVLTGAVIVASVLFVRSLRDIRLQGPVAVTAAEEVA